MAIQSEKKWDEFQSHMKEIILLCKEGNQASTKDLSLDELVEFHKLIRSLLQSSSELTTVLSTTRKKYGSAISKSRVNNGKSKSSLARDGLTSEVSTLKAELEALKLQLKLKNEETEENL